MVGIAVKNEVEIVCKSVTKTSYDEKLDSILIKDNKPFIEAKLPLEKLKEKNAKG